MSNGAEQGTLQPQRESINIESATEKIARAMHSVQETASLLDAMLDRLDGPSPRTEAAEKGQDCPSGQLPQLHLSLGMLQRNLVDLHGRVERINGLV